MVATARRWLPQFPLREARAGFEQLSSHFLPSLLVGKGLGEVVYVNLLPNQPKIPWRYFASGYEYLLFHTGLIGLFLYLLMAGSALAMAVKHLRVGGLSQEERLVLTCGALGMLVVLILNVLDATVDVPEGAIAFSLFYSMLATRSAAGGYPLSSTGHRQQREDRHIPRRIVGERFGAGKAGDL